MNAHSLNILLVDDEVIVTNYIKDVLTTWGHAVDVLHDGAEAFIRLSEQPYHYHLLMTDHFMWKVSGVELMAKLQEKPFKGRIVVISGYLTQELKAQYRSLGAYKIIRKPLGHDALRQAIEGLVPTALE